MTIPSLNALRVFEAVARHLSVVRASEELFVTQGAVSKQVRQLEEAIGVELFERRNRGIFLTRDGELLKHTCQDIFERLQTTMSKLHGPSSDRPLVVSCEPTITMRWLIPRLGSFKQQYPDIQLHMFAAGGPIDFNGTHVDLALRRDDFNWNKNYHSQLICHEYVGPVCAPSHVRNKEINFGEACLLHTHTRPEAWRIWSDMARIDVASSSSANFEHFYLSLQASNAGLGVAIASIYMVEEELKNGRLVAPYGFIPDGSSYYLLSSEPFDRDDRRGLFLEWLKTEFAQAQ